MVMVESKSCWRMTQPPGTSFVLSPSSLFPSFFNTSITVMSTMKRKKHRCLYCKEKFSSPESVTRHLNQPTRSCVPHHAELVRISDGFTHLRRLRQKQQEQARQTASEIFSESMQHIYFSLLTFLSIDKKSAFIIFHRQRTSCTR